VILSEEEAKKQNETRRMARAVAKLANATREDESGPSNEPGLKPKQSNMTNPLVSQSFDAVATMRPGYARKPGQDGGQQQGPAETEASSAQDRFRRRVSVCLGASAEAGT